MEFLHCTMESASLLISYWAASGHSLCISRYAGVYAMLKEQIPETEPVLEGLARRSSDDPCVVFHLSQIPEAPPW